MNVKFEQMRTINDDRKYNISILSEREKEVLVCLCNGMSNKQIGREMFISQRTVKNHIANIYAKLNLENRTQALIYAVKCNFVTL